MANLTRRHAFRKWAPDIGENRELEGGPVLWLEVATGMTGEQLSSMSARLARVSEDVAGLSTTEEVKAALKTSFVDALGPYVRVVGGPHQVDGATLATFDDYVGIVQAQADFGQLALKDLVATVTRFNSFAGPDELFLQRRSGGLASTGAQGVVKDSAPTGDQ